MTKTKRSWHALISLVAVVAILASVICMNIPGASALEVPLDADGDGQALKVSLAAGAANVSSKSVEVKDLDPTKTYDVTVWLKSTGALANANVWVDLYADGTKIAGASKNTGALLKSKVEDWTKCVLTGITGADSVKIGFWGKNNASGATDVDVFVDGLSIAEQGKVTTVTYGGWATAGTFTAETVTDATDDQNGDGTKHVISVTAAGSKVQYNKSIWVQNLDATKTYTISMWYKTTGWDNADISVKANTWRENGAGSSGMDAKPNIKAAKSEWTELKLTGIKAGVDTTKGETNIGFGLWMRTGADTKTYSIEIDNFTLTEETTATAVATSGMANTYASVVELVETTTTSTESTTEATTTTTTVVNTPSYELGEAVKVSPSFAAPNPTTGTKATVTKVTDATDDKDGDGIKTVISGTADVKGNIAQMWTAKSFDPNKKYTLTVWVKKTATTSTSLKFDIFGTNAAGEDNKNVADATASKITNDALTEWTKFEFVGINPKAAGDVAIKIYANLTGAYTIEIDAITMQEHIPTTTVTTTTTTVDGESGETTTTTESTTVPAGPDPVKDADGNNVALKVDIEAGKANLGSGEYTIDGLDASKTYKVTVYFENDGKIRNGNFWVNYTETGASSVTKKSTGKELQSAIDEWTKAVIEDITNTTSIKMGLWLSNSAEGAVDASIYLDGVVIEEVGGTWKETVDLTKFMKAGLAAELVSYAGETIPTTTKTPDSAKYADSIDVPNWAFAAGIKNATLKQGGKVSDTYIYFDASGEGEQNVVQAIVNLSDDYEVKNGVYDIYLWIKMSDLVNGNFYAIPDGQDVDGRRGKVTLKDKLEDWTQVVIEGVEVQNGELKLGFWGRGGGNQYVMIDGVQAKLRGTGYVASEEIYGTIVDVKNTAFNLGSYGMLAGGGKLTSTKIFVTGADDYKNDATYFAEGLEAGTYTVTAWVRSSGGHNKANMYANPDPAVSEAESRATFTGLVIDDWAQIEITGVEVDQSGTLKIGMWVNSKGGGWVEFDGVQIKRVIGTVASGDNDLTVPVALIVLSVLALGAVSVVCVSRKQTAC